MKEYDMKRKVIAMVCIALLLCVSLHIAPIHTHPYPEENCIVCDFINFFGTSLSYVTAEGDGIAPSVSFEKTLSVDKPDFLVTTGNLVLEKVLLLN